MTKAQAAEVPSASQTVVVIGLGYVGLPLAYAASIAGYRVIGLDRNRAVVNDLNAGHSHIDDISDAQVKEMLASDFSATADEDVVAAADVAIICVPTPLGKDGSPDLRAVEAAGATIARNLKHGGLVVLESTTFPGTTEDILAPALAGTTKTVGVDFNLAFSPERVDPGNLLFGIKNTPKVVGGVTPECTSRASEFYSAFVDSVVEAKGAREAETAKLLENTYRHINIALVNEMARVCHEMDIDVWDVIKCASTKPFGFHAFYPGPGVGGHCIPIDPSYLSYAVKSSLGYPLRFVELAQEINQTMPAYVSRRVQDMLNDLSLPMRGARVLLVGVTYKANISDQRESPADDLYAHLAKAGADVSYYDPLVDSWRPGFDEVRRVEDLNEMEFDIVVILQHHGVIDMDDVVNSAQCVLDTRGKLPHERVVHL